MDKTFFTGNGSMKIDTRNDFETRSLQQYPFRETSFPQYVPLNNEPINDLGIKNSFWSEINS